MQGQLYKTDHNPTNVNITENCIKNIQLFDDILLKSLPELIMNALL